MALRETCSSGAFGGPVVQDGRMRAAPDTCGPDGEPTQCKAEPEHDEGFANRLGEWTRLMLYR